MRPALVAASHGTASPDGQASVRALVDAVAQRLPGVEVRDAFVDVQQPDPPTVLAELGRSAVVVPLLLSAGYHVYVDLVRARDGAAGTRLAPALGPDPRLVDVLVERLDACGLRPDDRLVLVAAGSSEPLAVMDCHKMSALLSDRLGRPVTTAFLSAADPRLDAAVPALRAAGAGRVVVATYLLAPGFFVDLAVAAGADVTTPPLLLPDEPVAAGLVDLVVDRYLSQADW